MRVLLITLLFAFGQHGFAKVLEKSGVVRKKKQAIIIDEELLSLASDEGVVDLYPLIKRPKTDIFGHRSAYLAVWWSIIHRALG